MDREERRSHIQRLLDDLRLQREVDLNEALEEIIHLLLELDDAMKLMDERVSRLESRVATDP
jgi:hypothetical protein